MVCQRPPTIWHWYLLFGAAGALAIIVQTYLLREFLVLLQGDEMAVGLGLAAWFAGIAIGALVARIGSATHGRTIAGAALGVLGLLGCAQIAAARLARGPLGMPSFELLTLVPSLELAGCLFVPVGACVGGAFVGLAASAVAEFGGTKQAIGSLYVFEAAGALVGGALTSLMFAVSWAPMRGMGLLVGVAMFAMLPAALARAISLPRLLAAVATAGLLLAFSPAGSRLERATEQLRFVALAVGSPLIAFKNTPYQHIALGGAEQHSIYSNGQYLTSFPDPASDELLAHQFMLFSERPSRVLSFGGVETGLLRFCLMHPVTRFDLVLLDADAFALILPYFAPADREALRDPRVHIVFEDPRRFLGRPGVQYDLVVSLEPTPSTLLLSRTTSLEFDRIVRARLTHQGVYAVRFSAGANVQTGEVGALGAALHATLRGVFPVVRATPGPDAWFVAGLDPAWTTVRGHELERRYRDRRIGSETFVPELIPELFPQERVAAIDRELARSSRSVDRARDDRPMAFLHAMQMRQRISGSHVASLLDWSSRHEVCLVTLLLGPSLLLLAWHGLQRSPRAFRHAALHATAVTGTTGLASSLLLFVSFQTRVGVLYSELGVLSGVFMAGLTVGGVWARRGADQGALFRAQLSCSLLILAIAGALVLVDRVAFAGALQGLVHALLLAFAGVATGLVFPAAARELALIRAEDGSNSTVRVAAELEIWDHAGAAVAALLSAVLLIPSLGLVRCAGLLLALQIVALAVTYQAQRVRARAVVA